MASSHHKDELDSNTPLMLFEITVLLLVQLKIVKYVLMRYLITTPTSHISQWCTEPLNHPLN